jgi:hypothetical protein
VGKFKGIVTV